MTHGRVVALLGAESTGKTALACDLAQAIQAQFGLRCTWVAEYLREWCEREGRTPQPHEQVEIAEEQSRRIEEARLRHDLVVADTTALMTAVYSQFLFADESLRAPALAVQRAYALTLVTANDLPWVPDPKVRDGAHVREPVQALLFSGLRSAGIGHAVVEGAGPARLACALAHVQTQLKLY